MIKYIFAILVLLSCHFSINAQNVVRIFHHGNKTPDVILNYNIDSVYIADKDGILSQIFATTEGIVSYPLESINRIKFQLGENESFFRAYTHHIYVPIQTGLVSFFVAKINTADARTQLSGSSDYVTSLWEGYGGSCMSKVEAYLSSCPDEGRTFKIPIEIGDLKDTVYVHQLSDPLINGDNWHNDGQVVNVFTPDNQIVELSTCPLYKGLPEFLFFNEITNEYINDDWIMAERSDDMSKINLHFKENTGEYRSSDLYWPESDFSYIGSRIPILQLQAGIHSVEDHRSALRDIYDATGGSNGPNSENWWSDKPIYQWANINKDGHIYDSDRVLTITLKGVNGMVSPSFATIVDDALKIRYEDCTFFGKIPPEITNSPRWSRFGWDFIENNNPLSGNNIDFEGINLHLDDVSIVDFVDNKETTTMQVLAENKITWIFNAGAVDMIEGISDERVNKYLDYKDKGLGIVATVDGFWDVPYDEYAAYVTEQRRNGLPEEIMWTKGFDKADVGPLGSMSIIDNKGSLLWYSSFDQDILETYWTDQVDKVCRKYLGEPVEHEQYISKLYESTDYSNDGVVMTLQKAEIGNGIDVVFMGDQFVDTDLTENGVYETEMRKAMEYFFDIEPYRTLRNRFNVYSVKAVSKHNFRGNDHAFNHDNVKVMEYVSKIPDVDMDNVTVAVIDYDPNFQFFSSGYTEMFASGASIAYIQQGNAGPIIVHEAGGHGFAKLLDEYIYGEAMDNVVPDDQLDSFREYIKTNYHDRNWGMNVSSSDRPEEAPWREFLEDERYAGDVGLYQGAWLYPLNLWRPSENSVMNKDYTVFNVPSRKAIYERAMFLSEGSGWTFDYEEFVKFDKEVMSNEYVPKMTPREEFSPVIIHQSPRIRRAVNDSRTMELKDSVDTEMLQHEKSSVRKVINGDRTVICVPTD